VRGQMCQPHWWGESEQMHALLRPAGDRMYKTRDAMTRPIAWAAATGDRTTPLAPTGEEDQRAGQWQRYWIIKPTLPAAISH